jgi:hypothetical protein
MTFHWHTASIDERAAAVAALAAEGLVFDQVADALGIGKGSLQGFCFRNRDKVKRPPARNTEWHLLRTTAARDARIQELATAGDTPTAIARRLGVSVRRVEFVVNGGRPASDFVPRPRLEPTFAVYTLPPPETWAPIHDGPVADDGCAWPIEVDGERAGKCGAVIHKRSYCAHHHAVAYRPAAGRMLNVNEEPVRRRPIASAAAMAMAGVPARRMEVAE